MTPGRPVFVLRLEAKPGTDAIHALRRLLKVVGRQFQLRCVDAYEIPQPKPERTRAHDHNDRHPSSSRIDRSTNPTGGGDRRQRASCEDPREKPNSLNEIIGASAKSC